MAIQPDFARLVVQLQTTGLQQKDNRLYQLLKNMLQFIQQMQVATSQDIISNSGQTNVQQIINQIVLGDDGGDSDFVPIPGRNGLDGSPGPIGPAGLNPFLLGEEIYEDTFAIPGVQGPQGNPGATGADGLSLYLPGEECTHDEMPFVSPTSRVIDFLQQIITSGSQATVDFSNIPPGYSSFFVEYGNAQDTQAGTASTTLRVELNGDTTAANYTSSSRIGSQNGTAFGSVLAASTKGVQIGALPQAGNTNITSCGYVRVIAYTSGSHKRILAFNGCEDGSTNGTIFHSMARWKNTAVVNQITFTTDGTAFKDGSIFTLYGVR